jgi:glycosyltransferase involved in cell wall biosynthesis
MVVICKNDVNLQQYDEKFIEKTRVIQQVEDGIYQNFNLGILFAKGSLIAILNDDDWYDPGFLENAVASIMESNCDGVYGDTLIHGKGLPSKLVKSKGSLRQRLLFDFLGAYHTTFVLKKDSFLRFGLFKYQTLNGSPIGLANDYDWFINALLGGLNLNRSEKIMGNFSWGGASSLQRRRLIQEGRDIATSHARKRIEKFLVKLVWQLRLAYNIIRFLRA